MAAAFTQGMFALNSTGNQTVTVDLGTSRRFLAWVTVSMIDSLATFDRDNAVAADIFRVDGTTLPFAVSDGDHFGPPGSLSNVFQGAFAGTGRRITASLRVFHLEDLEAFGEVAVITLD